MYEIQPEAWISMNLEGIKEELKLIRLCLERMQKDFKENLFRI